MNVHTNAIRRCERRAAGDHGVIARSDALVEGLDEDAIKRLLRERRWLRLQPRAYVVAGAPITWRTQLAAIQASLERGFAFSHRTAGALLRLDPIMEGDLEIVTQGTPRLVGVQVHRIRTPLRQTIHIGGFPVTSAHRTILDLFAVKHPNLAELALEDALRKGLTAVDHLWEEYRTTCAHGRNGCRHFRQAVLDHDHRDGTLQSRMEAKLRRVVRDLPGESAVPQVEVTLPGGRYFLDFAFPSIKLGIEAQSIRWHMGKAKFYYDLRRDRHLKKAGWTVLYYSWDDLLTPLAVRDEIVEFRAQLTGF